MNYFYNGQSIAPGIMSIGFPNYINPYTKPTPAPLTNTIACQKVSFAVPPVPSFSSGCSSTPYPPSGYLWDFGEAGASSAQRTGVYQYCTPGTKKVSLRVISARDTIVYGPQNVKIGALPDFILVQLL